MRKLALLAAIALAVGVAGIAIAALPEDNVKLYTGCLPACARHAGTTYISKRYGYEIVLQGNYSMIQATRPWVGDFPFGDTGEVDVTVDETHDRKFIVGAKRVASGMSLRRWGAFVVSVQRQVCSRLRSFRSSSLGGVPAREFVNSCPGYEVITLAAIHHRRGYLLNYLSSPGSSATQERRIYERGRRTFRFTKT